MTWGRGWSPRRWHAATSSTWHRLGGCRRGLVAGPEPHGLGCAFHKCCPWPGSGAQLLLKLDQRPTQGISLGDTSPSPPGHQHPSPRLTQPVSTRLTPVVFTFTSQELGWQQGDLGSNPGSAADMC